MKKKLLAAMAVLVLADSLLVMCGEEIDPVNNSENNDVVADMGVDLANDADQEADAEMDAAPDIVEVRMTWVSGVSTTFQNYCSRCHSWTLDYDLVVSDLDGVRSQVEAGHGKLSEEDRAMVLAWIDDGAPEYLPQ